MNAMTQVHLASTPTHTIPALIQIAQFIPCDQAALVLDSWYGDLYDPAEWAAVKPILGTSAPSDALSDARHAADDGEEPFYSPHDSIDYVHGGYHERGDGDAWERWHEQHDAAVAIAEAEWRAGMVRMIQAVALVRGVGL